MQKKTTRVRNKNNSTLLNMKEMWQTVTTISGLNLTGWVIINRQQLYELYRQNPDIRTAIRKKALYVWKNGFKFKKDWEVLEGNDFSKLKEEITLINMVLANPTVINTKIEIIKHLDIVWEVFILPTWNVVDNKINGLQIIDPRTVTKNIVSWKVVSYTQNSGNKTLTFFPDTDWINKDPKKVMKNYLLEKHINNENMWMWLLEGIVRDAMADLEASKRNYQFFNNNMTPPSIFMLDPDLSKEETDILVEQLKEQYTWSKNSYKPLIGAGIEDVKILSVSPKDMEHILQRKLTTEKVASAFWVPKNILWYVDNVNYANWETLMKEFKDGTIEPYENMIEFMFNDIMETYMPEFEYTIQLESISLTDEYKLKDSMMKEQANGNISINEYRSFFNMDLSTEEWADKLLIASGRAFLEDAGMNFTIDKWENVSTQMND